MRIGIIYYGVYPWNRGIDQLAQSLRYINISPVVAAKTTQTGNEEIVNEIQVVPIFPSQSLKSFQFPYNPFWKKKLVAMGRKNRLEAMIVRETPLSRPVLAAAKTLGIPAYLDMRENLAAMYSTGKAKNFFFSLLRNELVIRLYERMHVSRFQDIFTVSEELKSWLIQAYSLNSQRVHVLENTPTEQFLTCIDRALKEVERPKDVIRLVYAGSIMEKKGLGCIIAALPEVVSANPDIRLRVIGDGRDLPRMKEMVHELGLDGVVEFLPMLSMPDLARALAESHVGIESCFLNELTQQTVPGKLFEYMAAGLPVLSSPRRPVKRILQETGAGIVFPSFAKHEIAQAVLRLIQDPEELRKMGTRARQTVLSRYNWEANIELLKRTICKRGCGC